jgi:hypothetical protein
MKKRERRSEATVGRVVLNGFIVPVVTLTEQVFVPPHSADPGHAIESDQTNPSRR